MYVAVSQRVVVDPEHGVRSDALDQRWWSFLAHCGLAPLPVPNDVEAARELVAGLPLRGIVLTGGNDLRVCGGDAPERDATEALLVESALRLGLPLLGVCRGMQVLQHRFGVPLQRVDGHVRERQTLRVNGSERVVNSYHRWAATETRPPLRPWVVTPDGVVEAVRHETAPLLGIMWHPERIAPFAEEDTALFRGHFGAAA
jgi:N5-(cytidine 5'-diphosphoramidyl)-L-glutamine hydrolase